MSDACDHDHEHNHDHHHHSAGGHHVHGHTSGPMLWVSLGITLAFVVCELTFGIRAKSLALMSDAGHNFSDALALGLAAYAIWVARKPANARKTFGYHRVAILTALFNSATLIVIAVSILGNAIGELRSPHAVDSGTMLWVAALALFLNTVIAALLHNRASESLNVRAAFVHMIGDALSALLVIIAAALYKYLHIVAADAAVSLVIALFIIYSSYHIVFEAVDVLLEGTPKGLDVDKLIAAIVDIENVNAVHDLHIWSVSDGMVYLSCHVEVAETRTMDEIETVLAKINGMLESDFKITHATIQTERDGACRTIDDNGVLSVYCSDHAPAH